VYLPDIACKQKPSICFSISLISGVVVERLALLKVADVLSLIGAAATIQLRQVSAVTKSCWGARYEP
jgi:hypothetical protein